jgi:hypothetical protein
MHKTQVERGWNEAVVALLYHWSGVTEQKNEKSSEKIVVLWVDKSDNFPSRYALLTAIFSLHPASYLNYSTLLQRTGS